MLPAGTILDELLADGGGRRWQDSMSVVEDPISKPLFGSNGIYDLAAVKRWSCSGFGRIAGNVIAGVGWSGGMWECGLVGRLDSGEGWGRG